MGMAYLGQQLLPDVVMCKQTVCHMRMFSKFIKNTDFKSAGAACRPASSIDTCHSSPEESIMLCMLSKYYTSTCYVLLILAVPCCICWSIRQSTMLSVAKRAAAQTNATMVHHLLGNMLKDIYES